MLKLFETIEFRGFVVFENFSELSRELFFNLLGGPIHDGGGTTGGALGKPGDWASSYQPPH